MALNEDILNLSTSLISITIDLILLAVPWIAHVILIRIHKGRHAMCRIIWIVSKRWIIAIAKLTAIS
jgi:hypothetical protein